MDELPQHVTRTFSFSSPVSVGGYKNAGRKEADATSPRQATENGAEEGRKEGRKLDGGRDAKLQIFCLGRLEGGGRHFAI